ncbi:MAG TPA: cupin domain-containing protein [Longimicrobiales bacterium]
MSTTEKPVVKRADAAPAKQLEAGKGASLQVLVGPDDGAPHFAMRRFRMEQGGGIPLHTNDVEHEQYVLRGRARMRVGDTVHEVKPDDVLFIPAGVPHSYEVLEGPFEFLCMVPNQPDQIRFIGE